MSLATGRVYISRHVWFLEHIFPFATSSQPSPSNKVHPTQPHRVPHDLPLISASSLPTYSPTPSSSHSSSISPTFSVSIPASCCPLSSFLYCDATFPRHPFFPTIGLYSHHHARAPSISFHPCKLEVNRVLADPIHDMLSPSPLLFLLLPLDLQRQTRILDGKKPWQMSSMPSYQTTLGLLFHITLP